MIELKPNYTKVDNFDTISLVHLHIL